MKVTGLRASGRKPGFVAVEVDGARFALLPVERLRALGLAVGRELEDEEAATLERAGEAEKAHEAAVRLLAARPRSVQEVLQRLRKKGYRPEAVSEVVGRLEDAGVLDDAEFARGYARARAERGYGPTRILAELSRKGVDRLTAEKALGDLWEEGEQASRVEALARRRARQLAHLPPEVRYRRLVAFLRRRGVEVGQALELARRVRETAVD